ncbi:hypothetical protein EVAR_104030_1 [Eumeta japonica]|uniref:Uncharacterized protein n=1 Tax=Eumeta variegata TaxID=151549 RepID=A0A4C1Z4Q9_EUMVA|nr:hypothetical protein EVAR_104030_1 [Eumeta japonica]
MQHDLRKKFMTCSVGKSGTKLLQARKSKRHQAFDVEDDPRSGRPVTDKVYVIFEKVELDRRISSYDVDGELRIDQETVLTPFKIAGYTRKLDT